MLKKLFSNKYFFHLYFVITIGLFLSRTLIFVSQLGGIEHDSGWFLGVARNLAERGIYASYTNTIKEEGKGAYSSIHGRFSVQDDKGFSYFPAGVTVGPGYILPEAILLKIFGYDFWQFRLWPLLTYIGLIILVFLIAYELGGLGSLILIQVWFWLAPQLTIQFSYESYGEHVALFYLLLSFYLMSLSWKKKKKYFLYALSGFLFSITILTKYLYLIASIGFFLLALVSLIRIPKRINTLKFWTVWLVFLALPILIFGLYEYIFIISNFGRQGWEAISKDFIQHFKSNGSGLGLSAIDWKFVARKTTFWEEVGLMPISGWVFTLMSPFIFLGYRKQKNLILYILLFGAFLATAVWFVLLSGFGWTRHVWHGLIIGMILVTAVAGKMWNNKKLRFGLILLAILAFFSPRLIFNAGKFESKFFLDQKMIDRWYWTRNERGLQGLPANPILSLTDQKELKSFFENNVKSEDRIYYLGWFLVAEASPIVDKVFYTYDRYEYLQKENPQRGISYLILGPYQKGKLSIVDRSYAPSKIANLCDRVVFNNSSYMLCTLRKDVFYNNRAYD